MLLAVLAGAGFSLLRTAKTLTSLTGKVGSFRLPLNNVKWSTSIALLDYQIHNPTNRPVQIGGGFFSVLVQDRLVATVQVHKSLQVAPLTTSTLRDIRVELDHGEILLAAGPAVLAGFKSGTLELNTVIEGTLRADGTSIPIYEPFPLRTELPGRSQAQEENP